jgi:tetratricopeptide (TPR) repeat protein
MISRSAPSMGYNRRVGMRVLVMALCLLAAGAAAEEPSDPDTRARALYESGKNAFEQGHYDAAYHAFKDAYLISQRPELLFNMASALERGNKPHEAAESLRAYLRVRPDDADRVRIEEHVRALDEKQRLIDAEHERVAPSPPVLAPPPPTPAASASKPVYKRWWLWTLVGVAAAGAAVGVGVGVSRAATTSYPAAAPTDGTFHF